MNEELTREWVQVACSQARVQGVLGEFSFSRRMLAWDSFEGLITDSIKQELAQAKIDLVICLLYTSDAADE